MALAIFEGMLADANVTVFYTENVNTARVQGGFVSRVSVSASIQLNDLNAATRQVYAWVLINAYLQMTN